MSWDEVIFQYDSTFDGFLCCVFDSYIHKELPIAFYSDEEVCVLSFYAVRTVHTIPENAQRVYRSLHKISPAATQLLRRAFLTCLDNKELYLYRFVRRLFRDGPAFLKNQSDEVYYPIAKAVRHMNGEVEKLRGFIRFSEYNDLLGAEIEPKNQVLPLLRHHFCSRYANESFFIYDRTHKELLLYAKGRSRIIPVDSIHLALPGEEELHYRALWKRFYDTIAIKERTNPRCQNSFLPKRYRGTMTEFLPVDQHHQPHSVSRAVQTTPSAIPANVQVPAAPDATLAPAIPPGSEQFDPASSL